MNRRTILLTVMILAAALMRLVPHPFNVTPITALALFGGARLTGSRSAYVLPLGALLLSDVFVGFHILMPAVYGAFALVVRFGRRLGLRRSPLAVAGATLAGSISFYLITNFAMWLVSEIYPRTVDGLVTCYLMGLPYLRNGVLGDLFYAGVLFGGLAVLERGLPRFRADEAAVPGA